MAQNQFFNEFAFATEQALLDSFWVESVSIYGKDMYYLPRRNGNLDPIMNEDAQPYFDTALTTTFYIKNVEGWQGQGNFLSALGLEIRDQITLTVAKTTWEAEIGPLPHPTDTHRTILRPREGDLIFFPLAPDRLFEVTFVEPFNVFFQLGKIYTYDLTVQMIEWSGQRLSTGIAVIDAIQPRLSEDQHDWALLGENGGELLTEDGKIIAVEDVDTHEIYPFDRAEDFHETGDLYLDFTETDPFTEGSFSIAINILGAGVLLEVLQWLGSFTSGMI